MDLTRQRELIDAAIAVNEAPTLDEAFQVVADAGVGLLGADRLSVVVWNEDLSGGIVRAAAGAAVDALGHEMPVDPQSMEALGTGEPIVGSPLPDGLAPAVRASVGQMSTVVRVPLATASCHATFNASWRTPLDEALPRFLHFLGDGVLVAHDAAFDIRHLNAAHRAWAGRPMGWSDRGG